MNKSIFFVFLLASLFFHFGGYWISYWFSAEPKSRPLTDIVEVTVFPASEKKTEEKPLVGFAEPPKELLDDSLEALKKKADYLSEKVQRVTKESRAERFGLTQNRPRDTLQKRDSLSDSSQKNLENLLREGGDLSFNTQVRPPAPSPANPLDLAPSTFGRSLDNNVPLGQFTALNSDRHLFYSFYARVERMIRPRWEREVTRVVRTQIKPNQSPPRGGWSTRIDVILDSEGRLKKILLLKESGLNGFDLAAIDAFKQAHFFPNPPQEMINSEGLIVMKYSFTVFGY